MIGEHDDCPCQIFVWMHVEGDGVFVDRITRGSAHASLESAYRKYSRTSGPSYLVEHVLDPYGEYIPVQEWYVSRDYTAQIDTWKRRNLE